MDGRPSYVPLYAAHAAFCQSTGQVSDLYLITNKANSERQSGDLPSSPRGIAVDMARKSVRTRKVRYKGHTVRVKVYRRNGRIVRLKVIKSPVKVKRKVLIRRIRRR